MFGKEFEQGNQSAGYYGDRGVCECSLWIRVAFAGNEQK